MAEEIKSVKEIKINTFFNDNGKSIMDVMEEDFMSFINKYLKQLEYKI